MLCFLELTRYNRSLQLNCAAIAVMEIPKLKRPNETPRTEQLRRL